MPYCPKFLENVRSDKINCYRNSSLIARCRESSVVQKVLRGSTSEITINILFASDIDWEETVLEAGRLLQNFVAETLK